MPFTTQVFYSSIRKPQLEKGVIAQLAAGFALWSGCPTVADIPKLSNEPETYNETLHSLRGMLLHFVALESLRQALRNPEPN